MALAAFAQASDLATRLKRTFDTATTAAVNAMLDDASAYLRDEVIGCHVFPRLQLTFKQKLSDWTSSRINGISLPSKPVVSVDAVTVDGIAVDFETDDAVVYLRPAFLLQHPRPDWSGSQPLVAITFTAGYTAAPPDLLRWSCVLASQSLALVEELGALGGGGVTSLAIDDYRKSWAAAGGDQAYDLPQRVADRLRATFGTSVYVTEGRP